MNLGRRIFNIFYNSFYWLLAFCLFLLILITPGDLIKQAHDHNQLVNLFGIVGIYGVTLLIGLSLWGTRTWTTKSALATIPKDRVPIEREDVSKNVRKMILGSLLRSAVVAWDARPRIQNSPTPEASFVFPDANVADDVAKPDTSDEGKGDEGKGKTTGLGLLHKRRRLEDKDERIIDINPDRPVWGEILHSGWSSPASPDLPNLEYTSVILELPHLIEARAVSVAPPDPESESDQPLPDIRAVDLLQRPPSMGLRDYVGHLMELDIITSQSTAIEFLAHYEEARFSPQYLSEASFRELMKLFAKLLRSIQALSPAILASLDIDSPDSDIDGDMSSTTTPRSASQVSIPSERSRNGSEGTVHKSPSRSARTTGVSRGRQMPPQLSNVPLTPRSKKRGLSKSPSIQSSLQSGRLYATSGGSSLSLSSSDQGSVIRLSPSEDVADLPYTLMVPGSSPIILRRSPSF